MIAEQQKHEASSQSPNFPPKLFGHLSFLHPKVPPPSMPPPGTPPPIPLPRDNMSTTKADIANNTTTTTNENNISPLDDEIIGRSYQNIIVDTNPAPNIPGRRNNNPVPDITNKLRKILLLSSLLTIVLESSSLIFKIFDPIKFVLGIYLILLSGILFCVETHLDKLMKPLHDNLGLLFNGYGRSFYLILLSSLSTSCGGILQYILSLIYFSCACCTFYLRCWYKEDLDDMYLIEEDDIVDMTKDVARRFLWTDASVADSGRDYGETFSLLV